MLHQITSAVVRAIDNHQDTVVSAVMGIVGTVIGAILAAIAAWWRGRGRIRFHPVRRVIKLGKVGTIGSTATATPEEATAAQVHIQFRTLNTYPNPKTLASISAELFTQKGWWRRKPLLSTDNVTMRLGITAKASTDEELELRQGFTRLIIDAWFSFPSGAEAAKKLAAAKAVRLTFVTDPDTIVHYWYDFGGFQDPAGATGVAVR